MIGHIQLGLPTDLRHYMVYNPTQLEETSANPFAARVSTSQPYGDISDWGDWTLSDWQAGVGHKDVEAGGDLYSSLDSRFSNQLILPFGLDFPVVRENLSSVRGYISGDTTVDGVTYTHYSSSFVNGASAYDVKTVWVYVDAPDGTVMTLAIYSNASDVPSVSQISSTSTITKYRPGPIWQKFEIEGKFTAAASTKYHIVLSANTQFSAPNFLNSSIASLHNGTSWVSNDYSFGYVISFVEIASVLGLESADSLLLENDDEIELLVGEIKFNWLAMAYNRLFGAYLNQFIEIDLDSGAYTQIKSCTNVITDMKAVGNTIYLAYETGYYTYDAATSSGTDYTAVPCKLFHLHGGYLYRANENDLYYSSDGINWTAIGDPVGWDGYEIQGMCGLDGDLYLSTDYGLYYLTPGEYIRPVTEWPVVDNQNGRSMVEWQGAIYISLNEDIVRFEPSAGLMQMGLRTGEELPGDIQGKTCMLYSTSHFLLASVESPYDDGYGTLWAYNNRGWHNIATMPMHAAGGAIVIDPANSALYWGGGYGLVAKLTYPMTVVNPVRNREDKFFARTGWIEQDRYYGDYVALPKDWESVYVDTETMDSATIYVYWQDQDSTDWELLGSSTTEDFELRWSDYDTRPDSKWIKLGLLFRTDSEDKTPIIRAHRVKSHAMVTDRARWSLSIMVHDDQEMLDGELNTYTADQMNTHLASLVETTGPLIYVHLDGTYHEVKVEGYRRRVSEYEWLIDNATAHIKWEWNLTLLEITTEDYVPSP